MLMPMAMPSSSRMNKQERKVANAGMRSISAIKIINKIVIIKFYNCRDYKNQGNTRAV